jgi:hemoglobin
MSAVSDEIQVVSLFDRIGGTEAVNAAVDIFYDKVLDDYRINRFFGKTDMAKQAAHLKAFMTLAFGGPNEYTGRSLRDGHARLVGLGLNDSHFDAVVEHLSATLHELNAPAELVAEALALVESTRGDVLGK